MDIKTKLFVLGIFAQSIDLSPLPHPTADSARIASGLNVLYIIVGSMSVLVITIAGFRYVLSHGDPNAIAQAKRMILYAVVGLLVTLSAFAITNFVLGRL